MSWSTRGFRWLLAALVVFLVHTVVQFEMILVPSLQSGVVSPSVPVLPSLVRPPPTNTTSYQLFFASHPLELVRRQLPSAPGAFPEVMLLGVPKSGTTFLFNYLTSLPHFNKPSKKEPLFFDFNRWRSDTAFEDYTRVFEQHYLSSRLSIDGTATTLVDDSWLYHTNVSTAELLSVLNPTVKLIVILRHPVSRALSNLWHLGVRWAFKKDTDAIMEEFAQACESDIAWLQECLQETDSVYECRLRYSRPQKAQAFTRVRMKCDVFSGLYASWLTPWLRFFSSDQLLVLNFDDLIREPRTFLDSVHTFLGLPPVSSFDVGAMEPSNPSGLHGGYREYTSPHVATLLNDFYRPWNEALHGLLSGYGLAQGNERWFARFEWPHPAPGAILTPGAFVTLADGEEYMQSALALSRSVRRVSSSAHPMVVLTTQWALYDAWRDTFAGMHDVQLRWIAPLSLPSALRSVKSTWRGAFQKVHVFNLTEFDSIVWLDADSVVLQSLDALFLPPFLPSSSTAVSAPGAWHKCVRTYEGIQSNLMVLRPSSAVFTELLQFFERSLPEHAVRGDQELIYRFFSQDTMGGVYELPPSFMQISTMCACAGTQLDIATQKAIMVQPKPWDKRMQRVSAELCSHDLRDMHYWKHPSRCHVYPVCRWRLLLAMDDPDP